MSRGVTAATTPQIRSRPKRAAIFRLLLWIPDIARTEASTMWCTKCKACRNTILTLPEAPATLDTAVLGPDMGHWGGSVLYPRMAFLSAPTPRIAEKVARNAGLSRGRVLG